MLAARTGACHGSAAHEADMVAAGRRVFKARELLCQDMVPTCGHAALARQVAPAAASDYTAASLRYRKRRSANGCVGALGGRACS